LQPAQILEQETAVEAENNMNAGLCYLCAFLYKMYLIAALPRWVFLCPFVPLRG
jgi:hypothetical protein